MEQLSQQSTPAPIQPKGFFTGVKIRPIIVGAVVDYIGTYVAMVLYLALFFMGDALKEGGASQEAVEKAFHQMISSPEGLITLFLIGVLGTVLGGYVAGRLAKTEEVKHGALVGAVSLALGILQSGSGAGSPVPHWYELLGYALTIPAGALGGSLVQSRDQSSIANGPKPPA